jgi:rhodanese-related sulfurtransferase
MKPDTRVLALVLALAALSLGACNKDSAQDRAGKKAVPALEVGKPAPGTVEVGQLVSLVQAGKCTVVDANNPTTRQDMGVIPGAKLLSNYEDYDLAELPAAKDQKLVFYCANESCGASHAAAEKALLAGYSDVNVFPGGIAGWKKAGNEVATVQ